MRLIKALYVGAVAAAVWGVAPVEAPAQVVYCVRPGFPVACVPRAVVRPGAAAAVVTPGVGAPGVGVTPGVGVGAPGVGVAPGVGAPGVGRAGAGVNAGGPVNRVGVR